MKSRRIIFTFDDKSVQFLEKVKEQFGVDTLAEAVRLSLQLTYSLQKQVKHGYSEIVARNPKTGREKIMGSSRLKNKY